VTAGHSAFSSAAELQTADRPAVDPHPGPALAFSSRKTERRLGGEWLLGARRFLQRAELQTKGSPVLLRSSCFGGCSGRSPPRTRYALCYPKNSAASWWGVTAGHSAFSPRGATHRPRIARRSIPTQHPLSPSAPARPSHVMVGSDRRALRVSSSVPTPQTPDRPAVDPHPAPASPFSTRKTQRRHGGE